MIEELKRVETELTGLEYHYRQELGFTGTREQWAALDELQISLRSLRRSIVQLERHKEK